MPLSVGTQQMLNDMSHNLEFSRYLGLGPTQLILFWMYNTRRDLLSNNNNMYTYLRRRYWECRHVYSTSLLCPKLLYDEVYGESAYRALLDVQQITREEERKIRIRVLTTTEDNIRVTNHFNSHYRLLP